VGESVRPALEVEVLRFYERLADAVESGSSEWLHGLVRDWVAARPVSVGQEHETFIPLVQGIRSVTWDIMSAEWSPAEALPAILTLERFFAATTLYLAEIENEVRLAEAETKMREVQTRLLQLDKSKSDFIAIAAHELRTPLTLIQGYADLLVEHLPSEMLQRNQPMLGGLTKATQRLREIIDDMVDVSLIDNQMLELQYEQIELRWLIEQVVADAQATLAERHLTLTLELPEAFETHADMARLFQVFKNLLSNAIKFTPDGGRIAVRARGLSGFVELAVVDTGIGIAPADQDRIFDRFAPSGDVTQHSTGKTKFKGSGAGLGLPIARGIVEAHGGAMWVESPGYDEVACPGSAFHIMIPRRAQPPPPRSSRLFDMFMGSTTIAPIRRS
jgi:signal transduction histidine kinase